MSARQVFQGKPNAIRGCSVAGVAGAESRVLVSVDAKRSLDGGAVSRDTAAIWGGDDEGVAKAFGSIEKGGQARGIDSIVVGDQYPRGFTCWLLLPKLSPARSLNDKGSANGCNDLLVVLPNIRVWEYG